VRLLGVVIKLLEMNRKISLPHYSILSKKTLAFHGFGNLSLTLQEEKYLVVFENIWTEKR
jgi:hypothetical protein